MPTAKSRSPTAQTIQRVALAEGEAGLPTKVPLHPFGTFTGNGQTYLFDEESLRLIKAQLEEKGHLFVVDWHHQTVDQEEKKRDDAPAALWLDDVVVEDGFVWGVVESWTPKGAERVASKEYRYLSSVFAYDPDTGRVLHYHSHGLLNRPGTYHQRAILSSDHRVAKLELSFDEVRQRLQDALRKRFGEEFGYVLEVYDDRIIFERYGGGLFELSYRLENEDVHFDSEPVEVQRTYTRVQTGMKVTNIMDERLKSILAALGLSQEATQEQISAKLSALTGAQGHMAALHALTGREKAGEQLGVLAAWKETSEQLTSLSAENERLKSEAEQREVAALLDAGEEAGKVSPAMKKAILEDDAFKPMRDNVVMLRAYLDAAPKLVSFKPEDTKKPGETTAVLSDDELAVATQMGLTAEAFKAQKAQMGVS